MFLYSGRTFTVLTLFFFCFTSFAFAQNVILTLGSGTVQPGGTVTVPLTLSGGMRPAAVQWTLLYSASITSVSTADGPAATAAGKNSTCASSSGQTICIVAGLNQNTIADGVVANVSFQVAPNAAGSLSIQMTGVVAASLSATAIPSTGTNGALSVAAGAAPSISAITCNPATLTGAGTASCTVSLNQAAGLGGAAIGLNSSNSNVRVPVSMSIPAGSASGNFAATVAGITGANQTALITGTLGSSSKSASLTLIAPPQVSALSCGASTLVTGASTSCTVSLVSVAPAGGVTVTLSRSTAAITIPGSVGVAGGASTAQFSATAATSATDQTVTLTASVGTSSKTASITVAAAPIFLLRGNTSEIMGTSAGTPVRPTNAPAGLAGTVNVLGNGYLNFAPVQNGYGLQFHNGGEQNVNTAFINFAGGQVGQLFKEQGEISFYVKSAYSFAERAALPIPNFRFVFDAFDNWGRQFYFAYYTVANRLVFLYGAWTTITNFYYVPAGQEDALFGRDRVAKIRMVWDGSCTRLYVNDQYVASSLYLRRAPNWTANSTFTVGAQNIRVYGGGLFALDDAVADLEIR
jgi:hypothetical protein